MENEQLCQKNKFWSEVFVRNIYSFIRYNADLSYITLNKKEKHCTRFYNKLHWQIYTTETNIDTVNAA